MSYAVPHTWVAGDFLRASYLNLTTTDLVDHEARIAALAAVGGNVVGQASSVDSEIALFSGTGGKTIKRASTTGLLKAASGVIAAASAGTDYVTPTGAEVLTNKTLTTPTLFAGVQLGAFVATLTNAQIKALPTTPITLIAAPGSGKRIVPIKGVWRAVIVAAYTNINATFSKLRLVYGNNLWEASTAVTDGVSPAELSSLIATTGTRSVPLHEWDDQPQPAANVENAALGISMDNNSSGDLTGGNVGNSLVVSFSYLVIG